MQLSFLGQPYETYSAAIEATPTQETGIFLGKRYAKKQFNVSQRQPTTELTYRGIRYIR